MSKMNEKRTLSILPENIKKEESRFQSVKLQMELHEEIKRTILKEIKVIDLPEEVMKEIIAGYIETLEDEWMMDAYKDEMFRRIYIFFPTENPHDYVLLKDDDPIGTEKRIRRNAFHRRDIDAILKVKKTFNHHGFDVGNARACCIWLQIAWNKFPKDKTEHVTMDNLLDLWENGEFTEENIWNDFLYYIIGNSYYMEDVYVSQTVIENRIEPDIEEDIEKAGFVINESKRTEYRLPT